VIAISWVFLAAAIATLIVGVFQDLVWVWISIGASVLALIFLLAGILRRKPVQPATAGAPYGPSPEEAAARGRPAAAATAAPVAPPAAPAPVPTPAAAPERRPARTAPAAPTPAAPTVAPAKKTAAKKPAAKKTAAKKTAAASSSSRSMVVAIPERGTFHKADCRYVKDRDDTERVQVGTAKTRGYTACGVCKP